VPSSGVGGVALNVTVTAPTSASFVTVWPTGEAQPDASNVNFYPDQTVANAAIVKVGNDGKVSFFNETGTVHLVVDVVGWFAADADFTPRVPARVLDTRRDGHTLDGVSTGGAQPANAPVSLTIEGRANVPATATAIVMNVTVVAPTADSFATVWPSGVPMPNASNLNFQAGRNVANLVVAQIGDDGRVALNYSAGLAYLIADVVGWFEGSAHYASLVPSRLLDTRSPNATVDSLYSGTGPVGPGGTIELPVLGRGGVPATGVDAVVVNVTATQPTVGGYVTTWPSGVAMPNASSLNFVAGRTVPNLVLVKVGAGGKISLFNEQGTTHLIVDVVGYFPNTLRVSTLFLPPAEAGTPYDTTLTASGSTPPYTWAVGGLAPGVSADATGHITGTPSAPGTVDALALVTDTAGGLGGAILSQHVFPNASGLVKVGPTVAFDSYSQPSPVAAGTTRDLDLSAIVAANAESVVLNVRTGGPKVGFLTLWAGGGPNPDYSQIINPAGYNAVNTIVVPLSASGHVSVFNLTTVDYRIEVAGYFGSGSAYSAGSPFRAYDSRGADGPLAEGATRTITIGGVNGVPTTGTAIVQITADVSSLDTLGFWDVVAAGATPSSTSVVWGGTTVQTVLVPLGPGGQIDVHSETGSDSANLIVDVFGWF
jgi:hypothetical protein